MREEGEPTKPPVAKGCAAIVAVAAAPVTPAITDKGTFGRAWTTAKAVCIMLSIIALALAFFACSFSILSLFLAIVAAADSLAVICCCRN